MTAPTRKLASLPMLLVVFWFVTAAAPALAATFFSTGDPDGRMGMASRPGGASGIEIESADDFILPTRTMLTGATFSGLLTPGSSLGGISSVDVEIYRIFPKDSDTTRTITVPTRANSPSDVAFAVKDSLFGDLAFTVTLINPAFTAANSVINGINPSPNQHTGGEGAVAGQEVLFAVDFTQPLVLPADHYFFVPQVALTAGDFLWLSAPKPIVSGTPFTPDLQTWIRNATLDPDWLRVGTDIVGSGTFNASFSLEGTPVPEPATMLLLGAGCAGLGLLRRGRRPNARPE